MNYTTILACPYLWTIELIKKYTLLLTTKWVPSTAVVNCGWQCKQCSGGCHLPLRLPLIGYKPSIFVLSNACDSHKELCCHGIVATKIVVHKFLQIIAVLLNVHSLSSDSPDILASLSHFDLMFIYRDDNIIVHTWPLRVPYDLHPVYLIVVQQS